VESRTGPLKAKEVIVTHLRRRSLYWAPRILCILFAAFLSVFAFDVFSEGGGFSEMALGFVMHLIPTVIILALLAIAWRWEWVGAIAFAALSVLYYLWTDGRFPFATYLAVSGPLFLVSALFLANWLMRKKLRPTARV
jgi:hypothetical protein